MLASWIQPAIFGGLFMASQALASPVPQIGINPPTTLITCGTSFAQQPKIDDCIAAINTIPNTPAPQMCTTVYITDSILASSGTCVIRIHDIGGRAHCPDRGRAKAAAMEVVNYCALKGEEFHVSGGEAELLGGLGGQKIGTTIIVGRV